jgi:hypothetical protein
MRCVRQVALANCAAVLSLLRVNTDNNLARAVAAHLHRVVFVDGDLVIRRHEYSYGMYFISCVCHARRRATP